MHFSQAFIRALQETPTWQAWQQDPTITAPVGNLLISGATAALRGSARLALIATSSFALRAMSQSVAREFGPQGVHVSHFVLDGKIGEYEKRVERSNIFSSHHVSRSHADRYGSGQILRRK